MAKHVLTALACLAMVAGCTPIKLGLSDDLRNNSDEYPVKGRQGILINQKLSFGEFATSKVKRSWTKGSSSKTGFGFGSNPYADDYENIIGVEYINKKQTLHFSLTDGTQSSEVYCVSKFHSEDLQIGKNANSGVNILLDLLGKGVSSESNFYVQIFTNRTDRPWQLLLNNQAAQANAKTYAGVFAQSKDDYYTIVPVTKLEAKGQLRNMPFGAAGFEVRNSEGRTVAAIDIMDKGVVYLGKTTSQERFLVANVCAALLLQEHIG